jgi:hypothetical protein
VRHPWAALLTAMLVRSIAGGDAQAVEGLVALHCEGCPTLREPELRRRLAIELPGLVLEPAMLRAASVAVTVVCFPSAVKLSLDDAITAKSLVRLIDLHHVAPEVHTRIVAIAVAELVLASWSELETNPTPRVAPLRRQPPAPQSASQALGAVQARGPGLPDHQLRLEAVGSTLVFSAGPLWGGGLALASDVRSAFGWSVDVLAHHRSIATGRGDVAIDVITAAARVLAQGRWSRLSLRGGFGLRAGTTILTGRGSASVRGDHVVWAAGGPMVNFSLGFTVVHRLSLELGGEGGYWVFPTGGLVNGQREVALEGPFVGVQLGLGLRL